MYEADSAVPARPKSAGAGSKNDPDEPQRPVVGRTNADQSAVDPPPAAPEVVIEVEGAYKIFGRHKAEALQRLRAGETREDVSALGTAAVIDASFQVRRGEIFVVMGLSGSGKSTLIRMLNGLNPTTAGSITVFGTEVVGLEGDELRELRRDRMSMVFQHFALLPHRTVVDNVAYGLEIQGMKKEERLAVAGEWLTRVGLAEWAENYPGDLSGGMQQRVGIARAFATGTEVLLMDEAFSALDPLIRREMQLQLIELQAELGRTIVFITHDLNEAMLLGDRIAVMRSGKIVQVGTPNEILQDPANDYVARFIEDVDRGRVLTASDVMEPARAFVAASAGPREALRKMRELQTSACFVTSRGRLLGYIWDEDALHMVREHDSNLRAHLRQAPAIAKESQLLQELYEPAVSTRLPIPVVGKNGKLLGVVPRVVLLAALADVPGPNQIENGLDVLVEPTTVSSQVIVTAQESYAKANGNAAADGDGARPTDSTAEEVAK